MLLLIITEIVDMGKSKKTTFRKTQHLVSHRTFVTVSPFFLVLVENVSWTDKEPNNILHYDKSCTIQKLLCLVMF